MPTTTISNSEIHCPSDIINSLRRGLIILELLATEPEGLLAKTVGFRTGLNLSTCYHLLNTLVAAGYVVKQPETQRFALTGKVTFPSFTSLEQARLVPHLLPHLNALRELTSETAYLSVRQGDEIIVSAIVESPQALRVSLLHVGYSGAAHAMALGKAILAFLPDQDVSAYFARFGMPALTQNTISNYPTLSTELTNVAQQGHSIDLEEFAPGVCCIGAPIFGMAGRIVGSLAISLPKSRYDSGSAILIQQVMATASAATRALTILRYIAPEEAPSMPAPSTRRQHPVLSHR